MRNKQRSPHLREVHTLRFYTSGVHTPNKEVHQSTKSHAIELSTLMCDVGPTCSYPHISTASGRLTHSGNRRSTRKESSRITDIRTAHNLWTQTITMGFTLCRGCTTVPVRIEPKPTITGSKPYHTAGVQVDNTLLSLPVWCGPCV
jgi:hypothetical protein